MESVSTLVKVDIQTIYINLDDSGKLSNKENVCVYGGIVFLSKKEKDKFITQYRAIIDDTKCHYCHQDKNTQCNSECPELKNFNLKPSHKRRIMNYIKKYYTIGCIISNARIFDYIMRDKASKGRYIDYAIRRLVKEVIKNLIKNNKIDPNLPVKIVLNIDEQSTKSNGYYGLKDGIIEELLHGISNFNYNTIHKPILFNSLEINLTYQHSDKSYVIQASDLIAGTIRHEFLNTKNNKMESMNNLSFIDYKLFLP